MHKHTDEIYQEGDDYSDYRLPVFYLSLNRSSNSSGEYRVTPNTLSPAEKEELNKLVNDVNAEVACSFYALLDFLNRMDEKYGESGWNINDFVG